jgi:electron transport complex protein RnfB
MTETATSAIAETVKQAEGLFRVDPHLCIACDACCQDFPEIFYMGGDQKAHALDDQKAALYNARTVVDVCPTDAILFSGELPPAEDLSKLEEVSGWELEWAKWRDAEEDTLERDRRYGRDYKVEEREGYVEVNLYFPTRVPAARDRFRYGMPEKMPEYGCHVWVVGSTLNITGWVKDPKIRALTNTSRSFPSRFTTTIEVNREIVGAKHRHDAHGRVTALLFTDRAKMDAWQWPAHFITTKCTACTICERVCPTNAITGGERFYIDPDLCINCSVCGVYCPFDAIDDDREVVVPKLTPKEVPKAVVHEELCTGCEFCVDVCPFEALEMQMCDDGFNRIAVVIEKNCVSCKLCEQVCIKDAIEVPRGHQFGEIGMSFMNYLNDGH